MFVILPIICFLLLSIIVRSESSDFRVSALVSSIVLGAIVFIQTEVLSMFHKLTFESLLVCWGGLALILFGLVIFFHPKAIAILPRHIGISREDTLFIFSLLAIFLVVLTIALQAPPNNWDSMTYHMSRVAHWIQNKTIAFYSTHDLRQIHQMPFTEYAIMHLQILSGGDRFANTIQWFSMVGSVLGVSLIAKEFSIPFYRQLFAAIICATIPMGILQASSTQNDYTTSFGLVCAVYFLIKANRRHTYTIITFAGIAVGLALLTKATSYVYILPFLLIEGAVMIRRYPKKALKSLFLIGAIALLINAPHYSRNFRLYGNPLGIEIEENGKHSYANANISFLIIMSNIIRNVALHLKTPYKEANQRIEDGICFFLGDEANNPASTWGGMSFHIGKRSFHEDAAGNFLHVLLITLSSISILLSKSSSKAQRRYLFCLVSAGVIFCAYLQWQPWNSRLHLPLFVLFSPIVAIGISNMLKRKYFLQLFALFMLITSIEWLSFNASRPLLYAANIFTMTRQQQYFANRPELMLPYVEAVDILIKEGVRNIGLLRGTNDWEYPLHVFFQRHYSHDYRLEHVNVTNGSRKFASSKFSPEGIIVTFKTGENAILVQNERYKKLYSNDPIAVFIKE